MTEDVDEIAVERACNGDRSISLNRAEMAAAVALHTRRGVSLHGSADLLGMPWRSIQRIRSGDTLLPHPRPGVSTVDSVKDKIATALKSEHAPVRRAAAKANQALASLDTVLAEWDAKEAALDRVRELEAELAKAKAVLRKPTKVSAAPGEAKQVRAWARERGIDVPAMGRIPSDVLDQWRTTGRGAA